MKQKIQNTHSQIENECSLTTFEYTASIVSTAIGIVNWWYSLQHDLIPFTHEKALSINQETIIINSNLKIAFLRGSN